MDPGQCCAAQGRIQRRDTASKFSNRELVVSVVRKLEVSISLVHQIRLSEIHWVLPSSCSSFEYALFLLFFFSFFINVIPNTQVLAVFTLFIVFLLDVTYLSICIILLRMIVISRSINNNNKHPHTHTSYIPPSTHTASPCTPNTHALISSYSPAKLRCVGCVGRGEVADIKPDGNFAG